MEDFQSKYNGEQVEAILDLVANGEAGGGGGGITVETDPVFSASPAASITEAKKTEWDAKYTKPNGGIPKTDLASAVQTSLGKADTALQSYTEQYTGTITGIKMNGASKGTSGVVDLGTVITSHQDISGKQDELVSGTNIKTINGQSILGSGDITISGDTGGGESSYAGNYPIMFLPETSESVTLSPNTYHVLNRVLSPDATEASLSVNLDVEAANSDIINEYVIELYVEWNGSEDEELPIQLDFSEFIDWANQDIPVLETNHVYLISIANNLGIWTKFS